MELRSSHEHLGVSSSYEIGRGLSEEYAQTAIEQLNAALQEKSREVELAAELGQALLSENKKLEEQLIILSNAKEYEVDQLNSKITYLESLLLQLSKDSQDSLSSAQDVRIQELERKLRAAEDESRRQKAKVSELMALCEASEKSRYDLLEEVEELKKGVETFRKDMSQDHEFRRTMREIVETQKQALEQANRLDEENKKELHKLAVEKKKLEDQLNFKEGVKNSVDELALENSQLKREAAHLKTSIKDYEILKSENIELKELLKDKEQLAESIAYLVSENKRFKLDQAELQLLLDDAKLAAADLREKLEESQFSKYGVNDSLDMEMEGPNLKERDVVNYLEAHYEELRDAVRHIQRSFEGEQVLPVQIPIPAAAAGELGAHPRKNSGAVDQTAAEQGTGDIGEATLPKEEPTSAEAASADWTERFRRERQKTALPPQKNNVEDVAIETNISKFRTRANTFSRYASLRMKSAARVTLEEKKYLLNQLDTKLQTAETKMQANTKDHQKKDDILEDLTQKLQYAEDKIRGKDTEIKQLQVINKELERTVSLKILPSKKIVQQILIPSPSSLTGNAKTGWLTKKGGIMPTWNRRWCTLSSTDGRLYYAKSSTERFLGMVILRGAYVQQDVTKKSGRDHCFLVVSEFDRRTYLMCADTETEMHEWIAAIQQQINVFSFG
eukprot:TRINITY_DN7493_c0_g1_i1.p1 TRINITY_DN7493_c0_g1~~TRINITY_DN7493_c0_g1_i1.p1  ORF type:complete len:699 (+),score=207.78 TRINITY_DN7493_c0_g1_i1:74-2098(+)